MSCQSDVLLGQNLTFSVCTHDPSTGILTDADAVPAYRIYEDETETPILTGTMAKLEDAETTGFYTEKIACTVANGFEAQKTYTIYISAAVSGDTGGISYNFRVKASDAPDGSGSITWTYTLTDDDTGDPIAGAEIWASTDSGGTNMVAYGVTDSSGVVTFYLDAGTIYIWRKMAGYSFNDPDTETVS